MNKYNNEIMTFIYIYIFSRKIFLFLFTFFCCCCLVSVLIKELVYGSKLRELLQCVRTQYGETCMQLTDTTTIIITDNFAN